jgi:hypothetical protein
MGDTVLVSQGLETYYSADHGQNWSRVAYPLPVSTFMGAVDGHHIYVDTYDPETGLHFYRTDDFFQTMHPIASSDTMLFYSTQAYGGYFYGSDIHGLYRTTDDGQSWEYITHRPVYAFQYDGSRLTAITDCQVIQTKDMGAHWETLRQECYGSIYQRDSLIFLFSYDQHVGCTVSKDYGQTWASHPGISFGNRVNQIRWYNNAVYVVNESNLLVSANFGSTWSAVTLPTRYPTISWHHLYAVGDTLLAGAGYYDQSAMYRSVDNGNTWNEYTNGFNSQAGNFQVLHQSLYATSIQGVYRLDSDLVNWKKVIDSPGEDLSVTDYLEPGGNLLLCDGHPLFSDNQGKTWQKAQVMDYYSQGSGARYLHQVGTKVLLVLVFEDLTNYFLSEDNGRTYASFPPLVTGDPEVYWDAVNFDDQYVYMLTNAGDIHRLDPETGIWSLIMSGVPTSSTRSFNNQVWVWGEHAVIYRFIDNNPVWYFTKDNGLTWQTGNAAPFGNAALVNCLRINDFLIAANRKGVFLSSDNGVNWTRWEEDLGPRSIAQVTVFSDRIWVAVDGGGIWSRSIADLEAHAVRGTVFWDQNGNGVRDAGEQGLAGVTVSNVTSGNATSTGSDGAYVLITQTPQTAIQMSPLDSNWGVSPASGYITPAPAQQLDFAVVFPQSKRPFVLNLWPNPATNLVQYTGGEPGSTLQIWDTDDNLVLEISEQNTAGTFSVAGLVNGIYWVRVKGVSNVWTAKLIVQGH